MFAFGLIFGLCLATPSQGTSQNDTPGENYHWDLGNSTTTALPYTNQGLQSNSDNTTTGPPKISAATSSPSRFVLEDTNLNWGISEQTNWGPDSPSTDPPEMELLGALTWQVSVFSKRVTPYERICGGTYVTNSAIISAASCYWRQEPLPPSWFAVGAGEVRSYRRDDYGSHKQQSDVQDIKFAPHFPASTDDTRGDIAVLLLKTSFYSAKGMRPACVSFDRGLQDRQLRDGNLGTLLTKAPGKDANGLSILTREQIPYIGVDECREALGDDVQYLNEAKICAGFRGGLEFSNNKYAHNFSRDIGSGLAFFLGDSPIAVPFLRGVNSRRINGISLFTNIQAHKDFLLEHIKDLEAICELYYPQLGSLLDEKPVKKKKVPHFQCNCYC